MSLLGISWFKFSWEHNMCGDIVKVLDKRPTWNIIPLVKKMKKNSICIINLNSEII